MAFTYRQLRDLYDTLHDAGVVTKSLPEWSTDMSAMTGTDLYDAGLNDNILKRASVGIDRMLEATPLPELGRDFGGGLGGLFGMEEQGREIGATLPRMAVDFLPMLAAGAVTGGAAPAAMLGGTALTGLLSGANAYTATGSPAAGVIAGGLNMVLPKIVGPAEQGVLSFIRNRGLAKGVDEAVLPRLSQGLVAKGFNEIGDPIATEGVKQLTSRSIGQSLAAEAGGQLAAAGVLTGSQVAQDAFSGNLQNPFTKEFALEQLLTQIPFTALHLGAKATKLGTSAMDRADQLDAAIQKTEQAMALKKAREELANRTPIEGIPKVEPLIGPLTEEQMRTQEETNSILSKLGKQREALKLDPTPENVEKLKEIQAQEDQAIESQFEKTGGVGMGLTGRDPIDADKIPVLGLDHFFKQSKGKTGYHVITVAEGSELVGVKYPTTGEEVKVGDRIGFPAGRFDPPVNSDPNNPQFLLPRTHFTKVVDRPYEKRVTETGDQTPELPLQKLTLDLEQHRFSLKALENLEAEHATIENLGGELDLLTKINAVRVEAGFPEIDFASLRASAFRAKIRGKGATKALIDESKRQLNAEVEGTQKRLEQIEQENKVQAVIMEQAAAGDSEAIKILKIYEELSGSSGRRGEIATSGLFWRKAGELAKEGKLTAARMASWKEGDVVATGAGLTKTPGTNKLPEVIFKALSQDEGAFITFVAENVVRITAGDTSPEAAVFKRLMMSGARDVMTGASKEFKSDFSPEAVADAAIDAGVLQEGKLVRGKTEEGEIEAGTLGIEEAAKEFARNFINTETASGQRVKGYLDQLQELQTKNALPARNPSPRPEAQEGTQIKAGGPFVWNLGRLDERTTASGKQRLSFDGKFTLPSTGVISVGDLKRLGGRGKPLQDVEIEMMKALDQAVGGGAFDGEKVNVKTLVKVLKENPVSVETHEYGMEGKENPAKAELDQITHEWVETQSPVLRSMLEAFLQGRYLESEMRNDLSNPATKAVSEAWNNPEWKAKFERFVELGNQSQKAAEESRGGPKATSYYRQISPFDTEKHPVLRVDVVLPVVRPDKSIGQTELNAARVEVHREDMRGLSGRALENRVAELERQYPEADYETEMGNEFVIYRRPTELQTTARQQQQDVNRQYLWTQDNLHENLPNTLGWAMVQFVPDPKTGETVMFVGEQQSRWGQEKQKNQKEFDANTKQKQEELDFYKNELANQKTEEGRKELQHNVDVLQRSFDRRLQEGVTKTPSHPLLPLQHILVLKAAIAEAKKRGVTKMIVSDGPSAGVTEMHDKAYVYGWRFKTPEEAKAFFAKNEKELPLELKGKHVLTVSEQGRPETIEKAKQMGADKLTRQEQGMSQHYDVLLQSAMRGLTGDKGEKVEMGVHKNVNDPTDAEYFNRMSMIDDEYFRGEISKEEQQRKQSELTRQSKGSPVFRDPDGSPKSSVTGTAYDLSKAQTTMESQGGFTLGDPNRAPQPKLAEPFVPQTERHIALAKALETDGLGLLSQVDNAEASPADRALAQSLLKSFPEALKMIQAGVRDVGGNFAQILENARVQIELDPSVVSAAPWYRNNIILHEVVHGLTLHSLEGIHARPELEGKIEAIRQRLIEGLSPKQRGWLDNAIKTDWMGEWVRDGSDAVYEKLAPGGTSKDHQILYALLNNKELVAQGFTSPSVREYMQSKKGPQTNKSAFKAFAGWVKELLNIGENVSQTEFENFMEASHQLMAHGEFLATAQQFGERFFEAKGKGGEYGKAQTTRALGLIAESEGGLTKSQIMASLGFGEDTFNKDLTRAQAKYEEILKDPDTNAYVTSVLAEGGDRTTAEFVETAIAEGRDISDHLDLLPEEASRYVYEKLRDNKDVLEVISAMTKKGTEGLVNIQKPEKLRAPVAKILKAIDRILENEVRQQELAQELVGLDALEPMGYLDKFARNPAPRPEEPASLTPEKETQSWLANFLEPLGQLARRVPESAELISKLFQQSSNARRSFSNRVKVLGTDNSSDFISPEPTHESVKRMSKVLQTPKLLGAIDKWIYWNQKEGGKAVTMLPESHPEVAKLLANLTPEEKAQVHEAVANQGMSTQQGHKDVLEYMKKEAVTTGAGVIMASGGSAKLKDAVGLSDALFNAVLKMHDPMTQWQGQTEIQNVQQRMAPEAFLDALKFAQGEAQKVFDQKTYFDANPNWATAQRTERYLVVGRKNNKPWKGQASSEKEARAIAEKLGVQLTEIKDQWHGNEDEPFAYPNMDPVMAKRMQEIEENQIQMLASKRILSSPEEVAEYKRTSAVMQILREAPAENALPGVQTPPRLLSQGAEDLPWMWNHISHAQRESNYWSRRLLRAEARVHLRDPEIAGNEIIQKRLSTAVENLLHPDPIPAQQMRKFMSTWFLGFNPATVLINAAQPFTTHVAELTAITGKPLDSYRRVMSALREAGSHKFTGREFADPEVDAFVKRATKNGEVGIGKYDDEAAAQESIAINYKRAMMKNKPQSLGQRLGTASGAYSTAGMWMFQHGERLNSLAALVAGFKLYREQGLSVPEAEAKAYEFNRAVNFSGGRAQRPVGAFSGRGAFPRTTAMLGTSLQSYVLGTTAQIARYLHSGLFRPQGLTPHEVYAARKAAIQMLGTQFAAAGLLGLPFASGAIALLDKLFPDLELNRRTREGLNDFLSSDKENGSVLTDIAMTGVPSMLGWDMQSRLSMGNTLPGVSEVNGFQPENLMGPASNIVRNFVGGVTGWASGDPSAAAKFLPPAAKKLIEAGRATLGGEAVSDFAGRPLEAPSSGEKLGMLLGFQPSRLSRQNAAGRILKATEENAKRRAGQENQEMAEEVLKGNFGTVRARLLQHSKEDRTYDPVSAVRNIARAAEELSFPRDLRREGSSRTASQRSSLLASYSGLTSQPSEVARLQLRVQVEQRLGLPPNPQSLKSQLALAQLMDQLKAAQPGATRAELRQAAELALRRSQPRVLQEVEDF